MQGYGAYKIDSENIHLSSRNVPTFYYNILNAEPLKMTDEKTHTYLSPDKYQIALNSKAEKNLLDATKPVSIDTQTIIILVALAVGFMALGYYFNGQFETIKNLIDPQV